MASRDKPKAGSPPAGDSNLVDLGQLLDLTRDSLIVLDWDGTIRYWNRAAEERYGYSRDEAVGRNAHELLKTEFPLPAEQIKEQVATQGEWQGELVHTRREGSKLVASSRWVRQEGHGPHPAIIEINTDITDLKRGAAALRQSEARMAAVIDSAMDAIISVNQDQHIVMFNSAAEKIFGYNAADVLGQPLDILIPRQFQGVHRQHVRDFGMTGVTKRSMTSPGLLTGLRANGKEFPIEASISQVKLDGDRIFTVVLRDITERVQAEEEARKQAEIIHQLSTPVLRVRPGLLVVPLIGNVDGARAGQLTQQLLDHIRSERARVVVMDITGVATLDTYVANHMIRTVKACRLLGAEVIVTGISRQTAQTLVGLGVDWGELETTSSLESGMELAEQFLVARFRGPRAA